MPSVVGNPVNESAVKVTFTHPLAKDPLNIMVNPDQVTWAYGLNTQSYPTYGGEVVQILSVYFDDLTITGTVTSYAEIESIYSWFISYMQKATQGIRVPSYNQQPVHFIYHDKGWEFDIWPRNLPAFRYGRDVVTPTWALTAPVKENETSFSGALISTLSDQIMSVSTFNAAYKNQLTTFGVATADFGNTGDLENNPFASSSAPGATKGNVAQYLTQEEDQLATGNKDSFASFLGDWTNSNLSSLPQFQNISVPANIKGTASSKANSKSATQKTGTVKKK